MKNRSTGEPFFVVCFTLIPKDDIEKKAEKPEEAPASSGGGDDDLD